MSPLFRNRSSQHVILHKVSNVTFVSAYSFGENNRRTVCKVGARMPAGKSQGVLGSLIWESHLHSCCHRVVAIEYQTLAFMIYLAGDTAHCILPLEKES
jgi:hypothetical protein